MNKDRRKTLSSAVESLKGVKEVLEAVEWQSLIDSLGSAKQEINEVQEGEQEAYEALSEGLQAAERGQRMEEVTSTLENQGSEIEDVEEILNGAANLASKIDEIIGEVEAAMD